MTQLSINKRSITALSLCIALSACQNLREKDPTPQVTMPTVFADAPASSAPSIAEQGYQEFFSDARLKQVIDLALTNNRDLRTAALNIQRAQEQYRITENNQLPTVGSNAAITRQETNSIASARPYTTYNVNVGITSYELDFFSRMKNLTDASLSNYLSTRSARDATQIALISNVAQAWLNINVLYANLALAENTYKTQKNMYELNKKRFQVGIDSEVSVRQAEISMETARGDIAAYKTQLAQAKNLLDLLVGQSVPEQLLAKQRVKSITNLQTLSTGLPSNLLANRPDIVANEYVLQAAGANIAAARAALFPRISLTGSAGLASTDLTDLFKSGAFIWKIGPQLDLPIFDYGTRKANVNISQVDQQLALSQYEKSIQTAFREVNDVLATRKFIEARLQSQSKLANATNVTYRLTDARFKTGIDSYLNVLDAQRNQYAAQKGVLALEQVKLVSQIELYKALGGGVRPIAFQTPEQLNSDSTKTIAYP